VRVCCAADTYPRSAPSGLSVKQCFFCASSSLAELPCIMAGGGHGRYSADPVAGTLHRPMRQVRVGF
jgi:hypothetical protein